MSYVGPGGQRPDQSRYYSPQVPGAVAQPSFAPSFNPNTTAYMSPTVNTAPAAYQSPPPTNPAQFVRQPSFVPETKPAPKGPVVDFSFDPRGVPASAVPAHVTTASRGSSGGFPVAPQHTPSFAPGPAYPAQIVQHATPAQYSSAPMQPTLVRQGSIAQTPTAIQQHQQQFAATGRMGSSAGIVPPGSPSALPLPQTPIQPATPVATPPSFSPGQPTAPTFSPGQPPSPVATPPSFNPVPTAAPVSLSSPHTTPVAPVASPIPTVPVAATGAAAPSFAPAPSPDLLRQLNETTERAKQAEENAIRLQAQLDASHKAFQELVSKQSKLELSSQGFTEQQKKFEDEIKQLTEKARTAEEKNAAGERRIAELTAQVTAVNDKAAANEKRAVAAEERGKGGEDKLRQLEERARKAEEQLVMLSSAQSQGSNTLAQQLAMREALEAALKEANDRLSKADGIWQGQNQRIAALEGELQQWRHQGPAKDLELQAALTREKTLKEALDQARKQAADSASLVQNRTQEALLQLEQRNAELQAAHQREAELKRLLEQRGPDSAGSGTKLVEMQAKLDAKTAELATAARREQAFREALEKAKKNLTDADAARAALEEDLAKAEENVHFFKEMAKNNEALAAAAEAKLERAISSAAGQPFAPAETPSPSSVLDNIRARLAALNTGAGSGDATAEALAELDGL